MNKRELILAVSESLPEGGIAQTDCTLVVEEVIRQMGKALVGGQKVRLRGFGTLAPRGYPAKRLRNPHTGEPMKVPAGKTVGFRPSQDLKKALNLKRTHK